LNRPTPVLKAYMSGASSCIQVLSIKARVAAMRSRASGCSAAFSKRPLPLGRATRATSRIFSFTPSTLIAIAFSSCSTEG
jgi:hypothetical protein